MRSLSVCDNILARDMLQYRLIRRCCGIKKREDFKMQDDVIFSYTEKNLYARIACDIDHHTARRIRERIDARMFADKPDRLTLDFSAVGFMDSSGLGLILGRVQTATALGAVVRLMGVSPSIMKLLRLSGIERVKNLTVMK